MSEHAPLLSQPELSPPPAEHLLTAGEKPLPSQEQQETVRQQQLEASREAIEQQALPAENVRQKQNEEAPDEPHLIHSELRSMALSRQLARVQKRLPVTQKVFSKIIHQPVIDTLSHAAESTVARPSGLLGGGLLAFVASSGLLYFSRHYGFSYNYLVFLLVFAGGFILGVLFDLLLKLRRAD